MQQLGIDIAKDKFDAALVVDAASERTKFKEKSFGNDLAGYERLARWIRARSSEAVHVCMEATGPYWEDLAEYLIDSGFMVSVVNPGLIKRESESWAMRNKTDESDARVIALYCLAKRPRAWVAPPSEVRVLRDLTRHLQNLEDEKQANRNRLDVAKSQAVRESLTQLVGFLDEQIESLKKQIKDHIDNHPNLKQDHDVLSSIKGIGTKTIAVILAELPDVSNFTCSKGPVAYAGLSPKRMTSGKWVGQTRLCKIGNAHLRRALYFPAMVAARFNPVIREFYCRLRTAGKSKMSALGACMRKLLALIYGVLRSGRPFQVPA